MRTIPSALQAKLDSGVTTLCRCWIVTRRDGVVQGFTDHDEDIVLGAVTCRAGTGLNGSRGDGAARPVRSTARRSRARCRRFAQRGRSRRRPLRCRDGRDASGRLERAVRCACCWPSGTLGEVRREGAAFTAEMRGLARSPRGRPAGGSTPRPARPIWAMRAARSISTDPAFHGIGQSSRRSSATSSFHRVGPRRLRGRLVHRRQADIGRAAPMPASPIEVKQHRVRRRRRHVRSVAGRCRSRSRRATPSPSRPAATSASRPAATASPTPSTSAASRTSRATISSSAIRCAGEPGNDGTALVKA